MSKDRQLDMIDNRGILQCDGRRRNDVDDNMGTEDLGLSPRRDDERLSLVDDNSRSRHDKAGGQLLQQKHRRTLRSQVLEIHLRLWKR